MNKNREVVSTAADGRPIYVYPKTTYSLRAKCEKWGVDKRRIKQRRRVLFTGTGRCGTTYIAKVMQIAGYDVQHEKCGTFGTASLFFLVDSPWHPMLPWYAGRNHVGERRSDYTFDVTIQLTRHPFNTIRSMSKIFNGLNYEYFEEAGVLPRDLKSSLHRCMYLYYALNALAEKQATLRVSLENVREYWPDILEYCGLSRRIEFPEMVKPANRGTGYRKAAPMTWKEMVALDFTLATRIAEMARIYGYGSIAL